MITTQEIVGLMVSDLAEISASDLVKKCNDLGMKQVPYQDVGLDSNLPPFEAGHHFRFNLDGKEEVLFEILEKDSLVLQTGYQLVLPAPLFFSKAKKRHRQFEEILENYYGVGSVMKVGGIKITNYRNDTTIAYISRAKGAGYTDVITVRVGNRRFWG